MQKQIKTKIFYFVLGVTIAVGITSVFAYSIFAPDVGFTPTDDTWDVEDVGGALDNLYETARCSQELVGTAWDYNYFGQRDIFVAPCKGTYKLEVWGAQGGSYNSTYFGGYGGYSTGNILLKRTEKVYIYVGGAGSNAAATGTTKTLNGGYNGGGQGGGTSTAVVGFASGGGATHIAKKDGLLTTLSSSLNDLLIVAGGGGGSWYQTSGYTLTLKGGAGGGYIGNSASGTMSTSAHTYTSGGTQTTGGKTGSYNTNVNAVTGQFGKGGGNTSCGSGSGGGLYGGGNTNCVAGGGGSSYIANPFLTDKAMFCFGCAESSNESTKTISTTGSSSERNTSTCSSGYSSSPISKCAKTGHGYAKITLISLD